MRTSLGGKLPPAALALVLGLLASAKAARADEDSLLHRGRMETGLGIAGTFSSNSTLSTSADRIASSATSIGLTLGPNLYFGYMIMDAIELRLVASYEYTDSEQSGVTVETQNLFAGGVQALYNVPLPLGLAYYVGVGGGGFGDLIHQPAKNAVIANPGGSNDIEGAGTSSDDGSIVGGLGQVLTGLVVQPTSRLTLRFGARADFLIGSRSFSDAAVNATSTNTVGVRLLFDAAVGARF